MGANYSDLVDRFQVPRVPWHDTAAVVCGEVAADFGRHFIQRWNVLSIRKLNSAQRRAKHHLRIYERFKSDMHLRDMVKNPPPLLIPRKPLSGHSLDALCGRKRSYLCKVQALRSSCTWSLDCNEASLSTPSYTARDDYCDQTQTSKAAPATASLNDPALENSILRAYIEMINNAEHYVPTREADNIPANLVKAAMETANCSVRNEIEIKNLNQHEVVLETPNLVRNLIADAIYRRILRAHQF
ncbi:Phospholipase, partial [Cichlidogyrus casuarinus]